MRGWQARHLRTLLWLLSMLGATPLAHAEEGDRAAAKALFKRGRELLDEGRVAEACERLEASRKLVDGAGTVYHLANCYEKLGRPAAAHRMFTSLSERLRREGDTERAEAAKQRARQLDNKVCRLHVDVTPKVPGLDVTMNGVPLADGQLGTPIVVDAGSYDILAHAPDYTTASQQVVANDCDGKTIDVRLSLAQPTVEPEPTTGPLPLPFPPPGTVLPGTRSSHGGMIAAGFVVGGVGLVGTITSVVLIAIGQNRVDEAIAEECPGGKCPLPENQAFLDEATTVRDVGYVMVGAAGSAFVVGLVLVITAYAREGESSAIGMSRDGGLQFSW